VASQSRDLHLEHLCVVLDLPVLNGLVLNLEKCSFAQREIDYPPLTDALSGSPTVLPWSKELQTAYDKAKSTLASANIQKIYLLLFSKLAKV